jgi:hypothetical protein
MHQYTTAPFAVLSTWKKDKKVTIIDDHDVDDANAKHRAKGRYLPLEDEWQSPGERAACSLPGYTGALCEFREHLAEHNLFTCILQNQLPFL